MSDIELYVSAAKYNEDQYLAIIDDSDDHRICVSAADSPQQAPICGSTFEGSS